MKNIITALLVFSCLLSFGQKKNENKIRHILHTQTTSWNTGDLEKFMIGYWENDSLMFIGKSGITYGWQKTLENYKKGYPTKEAMGILSFDIIQVKKLSSRYYFVLGKWHLKRTIGDLSGHYTLIFKKIKNNWVVISDHSS
jgi:hypothetical protein